LKQNYIEVFDDEHIGETFRCCRQPIVLHSLSDNVITVTCLLNTEE